MDDIYRHYAPRKKITKKQDAQHEDIEEFDGEVTGYAMEAPLPSGKVGLYEPSHEGKVSRDRGEVMHGGFAKESLRHDICMFHRAGDMLSSSSGQHSFHYGPMFSHFGHHGDFFPSIHEEYHYAPPQQQHHDHEEEDYGPVYSKGKGHDLSARDFFEIALTALAFLAFGLFVIQLMMNATVFEFGLI